MTDPAIKADHAVANAHLSLFGINLRQTPRDWEREEDTGVYFIGTPADGDDRVHLIEVVQAARHLVAGDARGARFILEHLTEHLQPNHQEVTP